jgi:hypothetical protein
VARHPADGKTHGQIREDLLAVFLGGTLCPIRSSPVFGHRMLDLRHAGAAGR